VLPEVQMLITLVSGPSYRPIQPSFDQSACVQAQFFSPYRDAKRFLIEPVFEVQHAEA
jgi:hypothetical protein